MQTRPTNPALTATFSDLVEEYVNYPVFAARTKRTLGDYRRILRKLGEVIGDMPLARLGGGDLIRLQWSQYDGHRISLTQGKTAQAVSVLVMALLKDALDCPSRRW